MSNAPGGYSGSYPSSVTNYYVPKNPMAPDAATATATNPQVPGASASMVDSNTPSWITDKLNSYANNMPNTQVDNYGRWNWANASAGTPQQQANSNPYMAQPSTQSASPGGNATAGGVYTGGSGPGGLIVDNLFGSGPPRSGTPGSNVGFGTDPAPAGTTPQAWQNFKFDNPASAFQTNYNYLQGINPELATAYGVSPFHNQEYKSGIDAMQHGGQAYNPQGNSWGDSLGNALIGAYNEGGGGDAITQSLGLPANWQSAYNPQMLGLGMDPMGKTLTINGQTYTLPQADTSYAQPKLWWQK